MKSRTTTEFRKLFADLPKQVQEQTRAAYRQFKEDPSYPSLRFKKVHPELSIYSARISKSYRAVGQLDGDTLVVQKSLERVAAQGVSNETRQIGWSIS